MNDMAVMELIMSAQQGDGVARENLIAQHRSFIRLTSCSICKRQLVWENDDELSIALLAFNEAIDAFDSKRGGKFLAFARQVISQRLIDYFRKERKHQHLSLSPLEGGYELGNVEKNQSIEVHRRKIQQEDLAEMMLEFDKRLADYEISLEQLADCCPRHRDTRERLLAVAKLLCTDENLLSSFRQKKRLPFSDLWQKARVSKRVLENGRRYIIALVIIMTEERFSAIKSFVGLD